MIDLKVYKGEKGQKQALELVNAMVEFRDIYEDVKNIAESSDGNYTVEQVNEARELISGGIFEFYARIKKFL